MKEDEREINFAEDEEKAALKNMDHALSPHTKEGLIVPMTFFDGPPEVYLYPVQELNEHGAINPMHFAEDFADGKIPSYLKYSPGYRLDPTVFGEPISSDFVHYLNPEYNLALNERHAIWEYRESKKYPPTKVTAKGSNQPVNTIEQATDPKTIASGEVVDKQVDSVDIEVVNTPTGMVCRTPKGDFSLANFSIEAVEKRIIHGSSQEKGISNEYKLTVTVREMSVPFVIAPKDINRIVDVIQGKFPECTVNVQVSKANALIANHVRNQLFALPERHYIKVTGFIKIMGKWVFAHDGAHFLGDNVVFQTGKTIAADLRYNPNGAFGFAMKFLAISERLHLTLMLLLVAHLSPMFNLFVEAGFVPRFVLFLNGRTGSMKTSVSLVAFRLFKEQPSSPEANFKDTEVALEIKMGEAYGRVILVDDYRPPVTAIDGKINQGKLEFIVRSSGDRIAKSRSNPELGKAKEFLPTGLPVITGEDLGGSQSSQLRMLIIPISKGDINGKLLKMFQDSPELLTTHMFYFLQWVGEHGDEIIEFIRSDFEAERNYFEGSLKERRVVDTAVTLMLTAKILHAYGCSVNGFAKGTEAQRLYEWRQAILQAVIESEGTSKAQNPVCMYLQALFDMLDRKEIYLAQDVSNFDASQHLGYKKDGNLWIWHKQAYAAVIRYCQKLGVMFPLSCDKVNEHLASAGLIRVDYEKRGDGAKKLYVHKSALPNRNRLMVLNEALARQYLENEIL